MFSFRFKTYRIEKVLWAPACYLCPICGRQVDQKVEMREFIIGHGGRYTGGPHLPNDPIYQTKFIDTMHHKCDCGMYYFGTFFLKKKPLTQSEKDFIQVFKNIASGKAEADKNHPS